MTDSGLKESRSEDYSPFHPDFDEKFPIDKLLTLENLKDVSRGLTDLNWISIFRNSPTNNGEAEIIMGKLVTAAARAGQWVDIPIMEDQPLGDEITLSDGTTLDFSGIKLEFTSGTNILVDNGYAVIQEDNEGGQWLSPTEKLLDFMAERLKSPYGIKEDTV